MVRHRKRASPMTAPRFRELKQLDAGIFQAEISSFALRLAAEGKAAKTIQTYAEAVRWFAAAGPPGQAARASWDQVTSQDIQRWMAWLLDRYSTAYASNQYRALQQFFRWLAAEDQQPDPMAGLAPPRVADKLVPVFTPGELSRLEQGAAERRRDLPDYHPAGPAVRRGRLPAPVPAPLQPHLAGPRRPEGDLMELAGWTSPQMLRRYGASRDLIRVGDRDGWVCGICRDPARPVHRPLGAVTILASDLTLEDVPAGAQADEPWEDVELTRLNS